MQTKNNEDVSYKLSKLKARKHERKKKIKKQAALYNQGHKHASSHVCTVSKRERKFFDYVQDILGEMLYTDPVDTTKDCLPSPEDLKYKVSEVLISRF